MLTFFRNLTNSFVGKILLGILFGLIIVSFAIFGIEDVFTARARDAVATVAGKDVTSAQYTVAFDRALRQVSEQQQRTVTREEAVEAGVVEQVLERLVGERALNALAEALGVVAADATIANEIRAIPAFKNSITGQFDKAQYEQVLGQNQLTVAEFEAELRGDFVRRKLLVASALGIAAPPGMGEIALAYATERRAVTFFPVDPRLTGREPTPTEAQLKEFYEEVKGRLMVPERRSLTLVVARPSAFESKVVVDEAKVRELFEFRKKDLAKPDTRTFVQIVAPDRAKAEQAATRLKAGEDAAKIAADLKLVAPITSENAARESIPDAKVAEAVFGAAVGAVVGPVEGSLSWSALKVESEAKGEVPTFESQAEALRAQIRKDEVNGLLTLATETFDDAVSKGGDFEASANTAGLQVIKLADVDAQGTSADGQTDATLLGAPDLLKKAFETAEGQYVEMAAIPDDSYAAVRVDEVKPSAPRPYAEVLPDLRQAWVARETQRRVEAKAQELVALAKAQGSSLEKAAASVSRPVDSIPQLLRGETNIVISQPLSQAIFAAKKGDVVTAPAANGVVYVVARIDSVLRDPAQARPDRVAQANDAMRQMLSEDVAGTLERAARVRFKARTFPEQARRALGLDIPPPPAGTLVAPKS